MKRFTAVGALALFLAAAGVAICGTDLRTQRLAGLGKLWAAAKFFHPGVAQQKVDWDQALVEALPAAAAARTREEYARAVEGMLAALQDPATRLMLPKSAAGLPMGARVELRPDGIVLVTLREQAGVRDAGQVVAELRRAGSLLAGARGAVFDLRGQGGWLDFDPSAVARWFIAANLNPRLAASGVRLPAQRSRLHSGLASASEGGSAYFHSAYYVRDGALYNGVASGGLRTAFLVDPSSCLPPIAPALQAAGQGVIIAEGGLTDASLVERYRIELPEGITALLRVSELLFEDGATGLEADLTVPARRNGEGPDAALEAALDWIRGGAAHRAARRRAPAAYATGVRDKAYAEPPLPSWEYRLLAGFRIWAAFEYFFAYRSLMDYDWERALVEAIPRLEQAATLREYGLALAEMTAHSADSHVTLEGPAVREALGEAQPAIRTRMIEGRPVVTALLDAEAASGVSIGDEILAVDGEEAGARLKRLSRYFAASTPQSLGHILMQQWLGGAPGSSVELTVRDPRGRQRGIRLERRILPATPWRSGDVMRLLPGNIGYADLDRLAPQQVEEMFERFRDTKAIIFDMRGYPRGTGWLIAPRLTDRRHVVAARFRRPIALAPAGILGDVETLGASWDFVQYLPESDGWKYRGRTVMLIDERAMSQAEHLGLFLEAANGTVFIGSPTAGADGDVARFTVPGGITISFSGHEVRHADGRRLQRVGLIPHVAVRPTLRGIRSGRDEVLEAALAWLGVRGVKLSGVGEAR